MAGWRALLWPGCAVALGAALGACVRWLVALRLNALFPQLPPGTLVVNLAGGYLIGIALAVVAWHPAVSPAWRLFAVTGFLGGLTTFSTFSAEVVTQLGQGRPGWALATIAAHVLGSLAMTGLGVASVEALRRLA